VTSITATVQKSIPKLDREVASPNPEADPQAAPEASPKRGFEAVMRAAARAPSAASADWGADEAEGTDEPDPKAGPGTGSGTVLAVPASDGAAILAGILSAARAAEAPAPAAPTESGNGIQGPAGAAPLASGLSAAAGIAGGPAGSGSDFDGATDAGIGRAPKVAVVDRAIHFAPVPSRAMPAAPVPAVTAPGSSGPAIAAAAAAAPTHIDAAAGPAVRTGLPDSAAAAAPKLPLLARIEPGLRLGDGAAGSGTAESDRADVSEPEDGRAIVRMTEPGHARDVPASAGRHALADYPASGLRAGDGAEPGSPLLGLPTIASAIADAIDPAAAQKPEARIHADPAVRPPPDGPLRMLRIQLRPEELGTVTVELRLADGQLETHLRASRPETAALLHRDAAILTDLLKQANYQAAVTVEPARPAEAGSFSGGAPPQGQSALTDGGARPGDGGDRQRQADQRPATDRRDGERMDETVRPRDGGVYL